MFHLQQLDSKMFHLQQLGGAFVGIKYVYSIIDDIRKVKTLSTTAARLFKPATIDSLLETHPNRWKMSDYKGIIASADTIEELKMKVPWIFL